jgi:TetR/AcrR family transcriptional repressor of mexJK operon
MTITEPNSDPRDDAGVAASPKRDAIVGAAIGLFLESGYGAVSMDAIAAAAGVSKRTVYSHFENKETLFGAVMGHLCSAMGGPTLDDGVPDGPPAQVLTDFGRKFLNIVSSPQALALYRVVTAEAPRLPELGEVFYEAGPRRFIDLMAAYLTEQDRKGTLRVAEPARAAAQFMAMIKDPLHLRLSLGVGPLPDQAELERAVASAVAVFLRGYTAP